MKLFFYNPRAKLIHAFKEEILHHQDNFRRALEGKSVFYIPSSYQRDKIETELVRLDYILVGIETLNKVREKTHPSFRSKIVSILSGNWHDEALTTSALEVMKSELCLQQKVHHPHSKIELAGLIELFRYLDCKKDAILNLADDKVEYSTYGTDLGYTYASKKFDILNIELTSKE